MSLTYTMESYDSSGNAPFDSITTEYKFSDGTRFVKIHEDAFRDGKPGKRTRVLRSDFEGDVEHRSTLKELEAYKDRATGVTMQMIEPIANAMQLQFIADTVSPFTDSETVTATHDGQHFLVTAVIHGDQTVTFKYPDNEYTPAEIVVLTRGRLLALKTVK